jgi:hypothetical protein
MKPITTSSTREALAGLVERLTSHNAENAFYVAGVTGHGEVAT